MIPLVLSVGMGCGIFFVMFFNLGQVHESDADKKARGEARTLLRSLPIDASLSDIKNEIENFNTRYSDGYLSLSLYKGREPVLGIQDYANSTESILTNTFSISEHSGEYQLIVTTTENETKRHIGEYQIVLTKTEIHTYTLLMGLRSLYLTMAAGIFVFIGLIAAIVFLTNRFLVRFVFNKINGSIDTLRYGVGQIRDGNLSCRLDINAKNEFDAVGADFNEMAQRLLDSVNSHIRDENTRKELIVGISHDLRTPLTSVRAYIEGIESGLDTTPEIRSRYIQIIKNRLRDLEQITDSLLLFSSLDINEFPWHMAETNLAKELELTISDLQDEYLLRGLEINFSKEGEKDLLANIDTRQMRNVMINILENSVKYKTKKQGKMNIRLSGDNSSVFISMTDDGPGVPEESLGRLFDAFYRVDTSRSEAVRGNGLGLAAAAKIVHSFSGTIRAENNPGGGLSIIIKLPLARVIQ